MEQEKELWGHTFKLVSNGLDEAEVYSFVESLIHQYGDLAKKIEHLDSVAGRLTTQYPDFSRDIDSKPSAPDLHTAPTNGLGDPLDTEKLQNLDALTSFAERTVIEAAKHARRIETESIERAKATANKIIADALHQASTHALPVRPQGNVPTSTDQADSTPFSMPLRPGTQAASTADDLKRDVQSVMNRIQAVVPDEAKEDFESVYANLLPLLGSLSGQPPTSSSGEQTSVPSEPTTPPDSAPEPPAEDMSEQQPVDRPAEDEGPDRSLFGGTVELALPPPVALDRMLQLHKHLKETPHIDVLNLGGSVDNGITIRILVDSPIPLLKILEELPEADEVAEELPDNEKRVPSREGDSEDQVRRIVITAKA